MKKYILNLLLALSFVSVFGQNENPYSQFGYEAPIMRAQKDIKSQDFIFAIVNTDTLSPVAFIILDPQNRRIDYYNKNNEILFSDSLQDYQMARWFTTDPYAQYASPYLGMGNNPVSLTDPNGGLTDYWKNLKIGKLEWYEHGTNPGADYEWYSPDFALKEVVIGVLSEKTINLALNDKNVLASLINRNSSLPRNLQQFLYNANIYKGQQEFIDHPITQATISVLIFVATGGIESITEALPSLYKTIGNETLKRSIQLNSLLNGVKRTAIKTVSKQFVRNTNIRTHKWIIRSNIKSNLYKIYNTEYNFIGRDAYNNLLKTYSYGKKINSIFN